MENSGWSSKLSSDEVMGYVMRNEVSKHQDSNLGQKQLEGIYKEYMPPGITVGFLLGI